MYVYYPRKDGELPFIQPFDRFVYLGDAGFFHIQFHAAQEPIQQVHIAALDKRIPMQLMKFLGASPGVVAKNSSTSSPAVQPQVGQPATGFPVHMGRNSQSAQGTHQPSGKFQPDRGGIDQQAFFRRINSPVASTTNCSPKKSILLGFQEAAISPWSSILRPVRACRTGRAGGLLPGSAVPCRAEPPGRCPWRPASQRQYWPCRYGL